MAFLLEEAEAPAVYDALTAADGLLISAGTAAEALIVSERRNLGEQMRTLFSDLGMEVVTVDAAFATHMARLSTMGQWRSPGLNLGDCFAYTLSVRRGAPLLCVGADFPQTDIELAIRH